MPTFGVNPATSTVPPWAVQQRIGTTAARYALNSMLMPRTDSGLTYTDYRSGVMASGDGDTTHLAMRVTTGSGMSVTVAQGNAVINTPNQGAYMCCLDSAKTLTVPASSATTNRYDLVVARIYDDNNSALSGTANVRQFTVELVQGDATTGVPTVPSGPVGSIPLASLYVGKNATNLNGTDPNKAEPRNAAVQDLRGPGIVARGGMRALYGADTQPGSVAYDQAGAYPGDQRWVHTSGFQHQVYYGQSQGWRGVHNCLIYNANPAPGETLWTTGTGALRSVCSVTIPDPGTPYMIFPSARFVATAQSPGTAVDVHIKLDNPNTGYAVNWVGDDTGNVNASTRHVYSVPPIMWGPFTGSHTVYLTVQVIATTSNGGFAYRGNDTGHNLLSVAVYPSTVQPPSW